MAEMEVDADAAAAATSADESKTAEPTAEAATAEPAAETTAEADLPSLAHTEKERLRFEVELEFVQCLANPGYLMHLAQTLVLEDENFLAYLEYLRYWKEPEYAKFIIYPHCLYMLDLLRDKGFRARLKDPQVTEMIHSQQFFHWQFNRAAATLDKAPSLAQAPVEANADAGGESMDMSA
ncbi:Mediator of RNA polymerase II transcription subunit 31 [Hondaea fermentalgiana]|uniref:Mediator of RNA polymerase II transcription subunit 31 n=1 Tax=Hondaea fermentalgiana TaxID=2315210 RepID=A0A2R5G887_9STRA|nr:Mediator of RNA polymerase II transcription subunit 31 [Hondaea fermentalgiana]|eukprot:GBG23904.1 Mediator of RNA polymerase II transcription subunit 31 [Hondaea fermentalgiana]